MRSLRTLLILVLLSVISACNRPQGAEAPDLSQEAQLAGFLDAGRVETELAAFLQEAFGLTSAKVTFEDEVINIYLEQPEALSDEQLMLLYLGSLDAAARFAPASERVALTIAVGGDPFISVASDTDQINDGDELEIDLAAGTVRDMTSGSQLTFGKIPEVMLRILDEGGLIPSIKKYGDFKI